METEIRMVGMEYDLNDPFKVMSLKFDFNIYKKDINEKGMYYGMFQVETREGDYTVDTRKETLKFKDGYIPDNLKIIDLRQKVKLHHFKNILGTDEGYEVLKRFIEKIKHKEIFINLSLNPRVIDRLNFDFETEHPEKYISDY